ncbi:MAG: FecR domain-containing protein, partial [Deltaproteobacteria bacterium]|nr:FecR domain-containing protein [Deltaproteobacteria bacterium]
MKPRLRPLSLLLLAAVLFTFAPVEAQRESEYDDDGIRQTVARVSYFEGDVSINSGDAPDEWLPASVNYPMTLGDRVWTGRNGRMALQLRGATVYLAAETELAALDLARDVRQLSLSLGTASIRINRLDRDETFEVATPNVSVTFERPGSYRVDVDEDGNSRVSVFQGRAWAAAAGGQVDLDRGDQIRVWGIERPDYDLVRVARTDSWDRWVEKRARRYRSVGSVSYVHPDIYGIDDLDAYGSWEDHAEYGSVWYPRGMAAGWEPYRSGRWIWRDPWGWTWLSSEPWGWAPYHYGRWAVVRGRWGWVPVGPGGQYPGYSPAVVGFVGGGGGGVSFSISVGGFVGWFPLGPREPFDPWWHRSRTNANVTGFNYAYRNRVTVVSRDVFVASGRVDRAVVRDERVLRDVSKAPLLRGPIPVLPTRESIRVSTVAVQGRAAIQPPKRIAQREVVTRTAPPPAPPSFDRKVEVIREKGGEPVPADVSRRLSVEQNRGETRVQPVRPAARGEVQLAPRGDAKNARKPQPLSPSSTHAPAAPERPALGRDETPQPRVPQPRQEAQPAPPAAAPRRGDAPAAPPARERAPAPEPELKREEPPMRAVPPMRPTERSLDRPAPPPTPKTARAPVTEPQREWTEAKPAPGRSDRAEPQKAEPKRVEQKPAEPRKVEPQRAEPQKAEPKRVEQKPAEPRKVEPQRAEPQRAEPNRVEQKPVEPRKVEPQRAEPQRVEPKQGEPRRVEPKRREGKPSP